MVPQSHSFKTSSKITRLIRQFSKAESKDEQLRLTHEMLQADTPRHGREVLVELANLRDDGCPRFWRLQSWVFPREPDADLLTLRNELRQVWNPNTPQVEKQRILDEWLAARPRRVPGFAGLTPRPWGSSDPWVADFRLRRIVPNPDSLRAILVSAVLEWSGRFAICGNPQCPVPYFVARREDQRYCERGDCTAYAQRQYALAWWNKEGRKRRAKRSKRRHLSRSRKRK